MDYNSTSHRCTRAMTCMTFRASAITRPRRRTVVSPQPGRSHKCQSMRLWLWPISRKISSSIRSRPDRHKATYKPSKCLGRTPCPLIQASTQPIPLRSETITGSPLQAQAIWPTTHLLETTSTISMVPRQLPHLSKTVTA